MPMPQRFKSWLSAVLLVLPLLPVRAQEYEIRMHRPSKVGDKFQTTVAAKEIQETTIAANNNPVESKKEDRSVAFSGVVEVLAVDAKGMPVKISATVEKLMKNEAGASSEVVPKGDVIVASLDGRKQVYQINGTPAGADVAKALDLTFSLSTSGVTDDEVFGTNEKKKAGESWGINAELAKKDFAESFGLNVEKMAGKVTFIGVANRADGDVLKLGVVMTIKAMPPMPPNFVVDQSSAEARMEGEFPVDATRPRPNESMSLKMNVTAHGQTPNGDKVALALHMEKSMQEKRTPLK
jgi:hypothetical protein